MAGSTIGGVKARDTNIKKYGEDFYRNIGAMGGKAGRTGGWYANPEAAAKAGRKGGTISRRGPAKPKVVERQSIWQKIIKGVSA